MSAYSSSSLSSQSLSSQMLAKFRIGFLVVTTALSLLIVICLIGLREISSARSTLTQGDDYMQFSLDLMILRNNLSRQRVLVREMMLVETRADIIARQKTIQELSGRNRTLLDSMHAYSSHTPELSAHLKQIETLYLNLESTRRTQVIPLILAGQLERAEDISLGQQNTNMTQLRAIADPLLESALEQHIVRASYAEAQQSAAVDFMYIMLIVVTAFMCVTVIYVVLAKPKALTQTIQADPSIANGE